MLGHLAVGLVLATAATPGVAFTWQDPRIAESSGLATSASGERVYTHNDSGDVARVFAVELDGVTRTTYVLPGLEPRDWEDMARGPDEQGRSSLWLGDIGDNTAQRDNGLLVHRVLEPEPTDEQEVTTEAPTSFRLRYPDGPQDAEALLVHPRTGRLYLVTKPLAGAARVYAAPQPLDTAGPNVLEHVAEATTSATGTAGGPGIGTIANYLVTAADVAPDGSRVAIRTYTDLYEWSVPGDDVAAAFDGEPTVTALPPTEQGEGLAYAADGGSLLLSTEGAGSQVYRVVPPPQPAPGKDAPDVDPGTGAGSPASPDDPAELAGSPPSRREGRAWWSCCCWCPPSAAGERSGRDRHHIRAHADPTSQRRDSRGAPAPRPPPRRPGGGGRPAARRRHRGERVVGGSPGRAPAAAT